MISFLFLFININSSTWSLSVIIQFGVILSHNHHHWSYPKHGSLQGHHQGGDLIGWCFCYVIAVCCLLCDCLCLLCDCLVRLQDSRIWHGCSCQERRYPRIKFCWVGLCVELSTTISYQTIINEVRGRVRKIAFIVIFGIVSLHWRTVKLS